jgi:hypothetical protein
MKGIQLNFPAIIAAAIAAVTVTILSSYLGVAGTITGAVVASLAGGICTALYQHFIATSGKAAAGQFRKLQQATPKKAAIAASMIAAFLCVITLGGVTVAEAITGKPVSAIFLGRKASGFTLGANHVASKPAPAPSVTASLVPVVPSTLAPSVMPLPGPESHSPGLTPSPLPSVTPSTLSPSPSLSGTPVISPSAT